MAEMYFLGNSTKGQMFGCLFLSENMMDKKLGVKEHIVAKDGAVRILL